MVSAVLALLLLAPPIVPSARAQSTAADVDVGLAVVDLDDRRYEEALGHLRRALELEPDHLEALYYMGVVHMAQRRPDAAVPFLERARAKAPTDRAVAVQLGLAYFAQERYDRAAPLLEAVFRAQPDLDGLGYSVGFIRYRNKNYRGALRAFRVGRASDPEIQLLTRVYTGRALAAVGLSTQAAEVEQSLRLAPGSPLTGPAERLRDVVVAARERARRFSAELRAGVFYDDNVRVLPNPVERGTADSLVSEVRGQSRRPRDSFGELLGLRAEYMWWRTPSWESSVGYSFFLSYYNDVPSFNITDHLATATLLHKNTLLDMPLQSGVQYAFDALFLDDDQFVGRHTLTTFTSLVDGDRSLTQLLGRYQNKGFNETQSTRGGESQDADNWMLGGQGFLRFADDRHYIMLGYQFDWEHAQGRNFTYRGHRLLTGLQVTLPWKAIRFKYDFDLHLRGYVFPHTLLPSDDPGHRKRYDKEFNHVVRIEIPLPYRFTLSAEYLKTVNESNLAVFDYNRNVTSLTLYWNY